MLRLFPEKGKRFSPELPRKGRNVPFVPAVLLVPSASGALCTRRPLRQKQPAQNAEFPKEKRQAVLDAE
ncbi:MAG: hypothetical protein ONB25_09460 [candidate division KSB1 bacterium]|nr:hypothetical protein [candidate division KSB1 bacterium]MDZ7414023.1 hypothetical protein [candidate division KSB1 bacterium]